MERLLTRQEAAALLRKPQSWLKYAERHGKIPFVRVGQQIRYRATDLSAWLERGLVRVGGAGGNGGSR